MISYSHTSDEVDRDRGCNEKTPTDLSTLDLFIRPQQIKHLVRHKASGCGVDLLDIMRPRGTYEFPATQDILIGLRIAGRGDAIIKYGRETISDAIMPGNVVVSPFNEPRIFSYDHDQRFTVLAIQPRPVFIKAVAELGESFEIFPARGIIKGDVDTLVLCHQALQRVISWNSDSEKLLIEAAAIVLLGALIKARKPVADKDPRFKGGLSLHQERRLREFIAQSFSQDIGINTLAELVDLSPSHFIRAFRISFQQTPHRYLVSIRCAKAFELINQRKMTLKEIAFLTGFSNRETLYRQIKKHFGVAPRHLNK